MSSKTSNSGNKKVFTELINFYKTLEFQNTDFSHLTVKQRNRFQQLFNNLEISSIKLSDDEQAQINMIKKKISGMQ